MAPLPLAKMNQETKPRQRRRSRLVPHEARIRSSRACTGCRRLKEKCDGAQPCARCLRTTRSCEYSHTEPTSTRTVEKDSERVKYLEQLVKHFLGPISLDVENLRSIVDRIGTRPSEDLVGSSLEQELNGLSLGEENFGVKPISQSVVHYSGEFSHWVFSQHVLRRVDQHLNEQKNKDESRDWPGEARVIEYWRATQLQSTGSHVLSILDCLPPRSVADQLAHTYLRFAQTNTFFIEPKWLQTKLAALYNRPTHLSSADSPWVCSVVMVLAVGMQFAHMTPLSPFIHIPYVEHDLQSADDGRIFYRMATMLIPDIITIASMESVQASLLLAHYALPLDTHGLAYLYVSLAMKLAIQNGMHRRYTGSDLAESTIEMRNRLWWATYTLERRISVLHGRPTSIVPSEMDADLPKDIIIDELDYPFSFENMSILIHMTTRLSDVSYSIARLRKCPKSLQSFYFKDILDKCEKLRVWWRATLEASPTQPTTSPRFRAKLHLQLYLHIIEIFIGRPFMFHTKELPDQVQLAETGGPAIAHRSSGRASLVDAAVTAAYQVIDLLQTLDNVAGLARASYVEFSACRAALLMLLAQSLNERSARLSSTIALGMSLIRSMAAGNTPSAKSETSVIEALEQAVRRLHMRETQRSDLDPGFRQDNIDAERNVLVHHDEWEILWDSLGVGMQQYFPGNDYPISPQCYILPECPNQQGLDNGGLATVGDDASSASGFDSIYLSAFMHDDGYTV